MSPPAATAPAGIAIEPATPDGRVDVLRVLDAAMLETDPAVVDAGINAGDVLVARFKRTDAVVGALVGVRPEPGRRHIDAVAVRRARRGRGIGSALVAAAVRRAEGDGDAGVVTAAFAPRLEGFYTGLGFDIGDPSAGEYDTDDGDTDAADPNRLSGRRAV